MRKTLAIFTFIALGCIIGFIPAVGQSYGGIVSVGNTTAEPGKIFSADVSLAGNDIGVTSLRIPLELSSSTATITAVTFDGALLAQGMEASYEIDGQRVTIYYTPGATSPIPAITAASGLLATIHMTTPADAADEDIIIDAVSVDSPFESGGQTYHHWTRIEFTDESGSGAQLPAFSSGTFELRSPTDVDDPMGNLPNEFALHQNYPNPFNPGTTIDFALPQKTNVRLEIFNLLGQKIALLANGVYPAGVHSVRWNASGSPSGVYFYRLTTGSKSLTRKMALLK
jgi:hypothetical protein